MCTNPIDAKRTGLELESATLSSRVILKNPWYDRTFIAKSGTATNIDRPEAAGTLHIYAYDYIYDNKDRDDEWNRARPL